MKANESSVTSLVSAFGRAYHSKHDTPKVFDDFFAEKLITEKELADISENMIKGISFFNREIAEKFKEQPEEILKWITQVQLSPTPLARAAYCEEVLAIEMRLGLQQYVILGAGLDTFCFRHPELENSLEIYEMDHPATQAFKRSRLAQADLEIPKNLHMIPVDFTEEFSFESIQERGFQNKKTLFSLLGVTFYLTKDENSRLFSELFTKVPEGSSIVFDYADENLFKEKGFSNRVENMLKMTLAGGEVMKSCFSYHEIEKMLEDAGLLIFEHLSPTDINNRFFRHRTDYLRAFETVHYIHAVKK
ncbi:class I SAM-dependent methyltransferase [Neobacillus cucumis]|uniref:class I SAM-dependent methyltransferase n=1 Tax=Neobacillus cucumis TaxID=1740721 RepID=UPI0019650483|nr:class I SAM-dependent methyltransferase [Neobacillus cucumis]MBM7655277.1 methyltransferase (TIGR00027 family) [Neobacillus cucumis]